MVSEWVRKADLDFQTVARLVAEDAFRDIAVFHARQAAEKYLKALPTKRRTINDSANVRDPFAASPNAKRGPTLPRIGTSGQFWRFAGQATSKLT